MRGVVELVRAEAEPQWRPSSVSFSRRRDSAVMRRMRLERRMRDVTRVRVRVLGKPQAFKCGKVLRRTGRLAWGRIQGCSVRQLAS